MAGVLTLKFGYPAAAAAASTYQRMLPNGADVSMTGTNQYVAAGPNGAGAVSETGS